MSELVHWARLPWVETACGSPKARSWAPQIKNVTCLECLRRLAGKPVVDLTVEEREGIDEFQARELRRLEKKISAANGPPIA